MPVGEARYQSEKTGSGVSATLASARNTQNRSNPRVNQRSWVTATTVPS